jgi:hypothetical protein
VKSPARLIQLMKDSLPIARTVRKMQTCDVPYMSVRPVHHIFWAERERGMRSGRPS